MKFNNNVDMRMQLQKSERKSVKFLRNYGQITQRIYVCMSVLCVDVCEYSNIVAEL